MTLLEKMEDKVLFDCIPDSWELLDTAMNDYKFCSDAVKFYLDFYPSKKNQMLERYQLMNA